MARSWAEPFATQTSSQEEFGLRTLTCLTSPFCCLPPLEGKPGVSESPGGIHLYSHPRGLTLRAALPLHKLNSWEWKIVRCEMTLVFRARAEKLQELAWWCFP